jgi:hypothetical protein
MKWRSPFWMAQTLGGVDLPTEGVHLFVNGAEDSLIVVAAHEAFFNMKISALGQIFAQVELIAPAECAGNLCLTVFNLVQMVLSCSDEVAIDIVAKRFASNDIGIAGMNACLDMDACLEVLDDQDARKIHQEQKEVETTLQELQLFEQDFVTRRRRINDAKLAAAKAAPKGKAKAKAKAKVTLPNDIAQTDAKIYIPPSSSIWRGRVKRCWNGHVPPRARISEPWADDEMASLHIILKRMWQQHIDLNGLTWLACPWKFE